jgi:hypothetical protein
VRKLGYNDAGNPATTLKPMTQVLKIRLPEYRGE